VRGRLPNSEEAILDIRKIEDYCLNASHPGGRHKARVFRDALGLQRRDAPWLRDALLEAARTGDATQVLADVWGRYRPVEQSKRSLPRHAPRFVSAWVMG
jgi:hypothetical protein